MATRAGERNGGHVPEVRLLDRDHRESLREYLGSCTNPGLLLYRFQDGRKAEGEGIEEEKQRFQEMWLAYAQRANALWGQNGYPALRAGLVRRQAETLSDLAIRGWKTVDLLCRANSRIAIGMSYGRLWSISFHLHPLYGVPFIPSSSLKGAVRHRMQETWGELPEAASADELAQFEVRRQEEIELLMGGEEEGARVMFLDAFACQPSECGSAKQSGKKDRSFLVEDVVNKHFHSYFEQEQPGIPADYCEPKPVKFLTIRVGTLFRVRYAVAPDENVPEAMLARVKASVSDCLRFHGVGAKTRGGYGSFGLVEEG